MINKIFQIGFNKCGTLSLHVLFSQYTDPKIKSIHWDNGRLATKIYQNLLNNQLLLSGYEPYTFFSDMEVCFEDINNDPHWFFVYLNLFKVLDKQYPNSKFILNVRPIANWIESRKRHNSPSLHDKNKSYFESQKRFYRLDNQSLVAKWKKDWDDHLLNVTDYFRDRPQDLLIFDIERDPLVKLVTFFKADLKFTTNTLPYYQKTKI